MAVQQDEKERVDDCLICLQPTNERSSDLFLYNCTCLYAVHANCFRDWRRLTETSRICLLCREGLMPMGAEDNRVVPHQPPPHPFRPAYGVFQLWIFHPNNVNKNICVAGLFVCFVFVLFHHFTARQSPAVTPPPYYTLTPLGPLGQNRLLL
jgi:hypothetical protein